MARDEERRHRAEQGPIVGGLPAVPGIGAAMRLTPGLGTHLRGRLEQRFANHHHVGDVRGRGLFQAVEIVADRATKEPFDPKLKLHARIKRAALERGLMVYPMGGTVDGVRGDHVLLAPPFIVDDAALEVIVDRLGDAIDDALTAAKSTAA